MNINKTQVVVTLPDTMDEDLDALRAVLKTIGGKVVAAQAGVPYHHVNRFIKGLTFSHCYSPTLVSRLYEVAFQHFSDRHNELAARSNALRVERERLREEIARFKPLYLKFSKEVSKNIPAPKPGTGIRPGKP